MAFVGMVLVVLLGLTVNDQNAVVKHDLLNGIKNTTAIAVYKVNE